MIAPRAPLVNMPGRVYFTPYGFHPATFDQMPYAMTPSESDL